MKLKLTILSLLVSLCVSIKYNAVAQDYKFSQVFSNPLLINPAYAGTLGRSRGSTTYRNQWKGEDVAFAASFDQYIPKLLGGVGLQFISDRYMNGYLKEKNINGMYAYNISINENMQIRPAITIGLGLLQIDWGQLNRPSEFIPESYHKYYFNTGVGMLLAWKKSVSGISIDHINIPHAFAYSESRLLPKLTVHANYQIDINTNFSLTPGIVFQYQDNSHYFLPSLMAKLWYFKVGIASSSQIDDPGYLIGMIGFETKWMSLGYSYDNYKQWWIPAYYNPKKGIHEFTAAFNFNFTKNKEEKRITLFGGF